MTAPTAETPRPRRASYVLHLVSLPDRGPAGGEAFPAGQLRLIGMIDEVLDLFDAEPRFQHFTLDQTYSLEEYLSIRPENFERVEEAVRENKLLVGPWFVQPETMSGSPESIIRNLMIGLRTARVFGPPMRVGYVADPRGVTEWLPQIFKGFGIEVAIIASNNTAVLPMEFTWEGNDGTQIIACHLNEESATTSETTIQDLRDKLAPYADSGHILLPQRWKSVESVPDTITAARTGSYDDIFHSALTAYAKAVQTFARANPLPTISVPGETAPCADISQLALTELIEPLTVWAEYSDRHEFLIERPQRLLEKLWRDVLLNQKPANDAYSLKERDARRERIAQYGIFVENISLAPGSTLLDDPFIERVVKTSESQFFITAAKLPHDAERSGLIVRGHNTTAEPLWLTLTPWRSFATVDVVTLDETPTGGRLAVEPNGAIQFKAAPHHLLTFWFHD